MRATILSVVLAAAAHLLPATAQAGAPTCQVHTSGPYCSYTGTVARAYINESNIVLLYFDTPMDLAQPAAVGIDNITAATAAAYRLTDNPDFGRALYSSLLAAQARGATITVQMRNREGGYLRIDRIWVYD